MPAEDDLRVRPLLAEQADQVGNVLLELADMVDVAAPDRIFAMAAHVGDDDGREARIGDRGRHRVELHAVPGRAMDQDDETVGAARRVVATIGEGRPVAGSEHDRLRQRCVVGFERLGEADAAITGVGVCGRSLGHDQADGQKKVYGGRSRREHHDLEKHGPPQSCRRFQS